MENILVTGGVGFVGTHLCRRLVGLGHKVTSLDLRKPSSNAAAGPAGTALTASASNPIVSGVEYVQGDVRDAKLLRQLIDRATIVYHLAATVSVPLCQKDPIESYSNNFNATLLVLETIRQSAEQNKKKPAGLVFASTAAIYGAMGDDGRALRESDVPTEFLSYYAAQKHASEKAIELYKSTHGVPATVFRFFNIYGPGQDPSSPYSGVITLFMKFAREGKPMPLNAGGHQTRDFISVHDIVTGIVAPLGFPRETWKPAPMNLGSGTKITVKEIASIIRELNGNKSEITTAPPREGDVVHSLADISAARNRVGFAPKYKLSEGLAELVKSQS